MTLKMECPTCGKQVRSIQAEFENSTTKFIVFGCGHLYTQEKILASPEILAAKLPVPSSKESSIPEETTAIFQKAAGQKPADSFWFQAQAPVAISFDPWSKEEKYAALDQWVSDGGAISVPQAILDEIEREENARIRRESFMSIDKDWTARDYQMSGVEFAEASQLCCLIADDMGLGKTAEAILAMRRNRQITSPTLFVVKATTVYQWQAQLVKWYGMNIMDVMAITNRIHIFPGFNTYIISMDFIKQKGVLDMLKTIPFKSIVVDECHNLNDMDSKRTKALVELTKFHDIKYKILISGTPIKNRLSEYFFALNYLDPWHFPSETRFRNSWLSCNEKGQYTKIIPWKIDDFKALTGKYIIRRERAEVLKDLPELTKDYQIVEIEDEWLKKSYNHEIGLFNSFLNENSGHITQMELLGWLARIRNITGMAKVSLAVDWIDDFFSIMDGNLAIGVHHEGVRETLVTAFRARGIKCESLSGADSAWRKQDIVRRFSNGETRLLVMNILAGGEGIDGLQNKCSNALVIERQWNPAAEDQFAARFQRLGQKNPVTLTTLIAKGTIDEFFHEMNYGKRKDLETGGFRNLEDPSTSLKDLLEFSEYIAGKTI